MTITDDVINRLRHTANNLDGDHWHAEGNSVYGSAYDAGDQVCYDHIASCETVNGNSPGADFIAEADPATILAILTHIDAQAARIAELEEEAGHYKERYWVSQRELAARIAEQQAVIDQRNGECDRLINELAALRKQKIQPAPVAVPDELPKQLEVVGYNDGWNACRAEVLRLNSGSKPKRFVVKMMGDAVVFEHVQNGLAEYGMLPNGQKVTSQFAAGWNLRGEREKLTIRAAGGEIAE